MKTNRLLLLLALATLFTGCFTRRYDIALRNGYTVTAKGKPQLDERGYYHYTDAEGKETTIYSGQVRQIAPHESTREKDKFFVTPSGSR